MNLSKLQETVKNKKAGVLQFTELQTAGPSKRKQELVWNSNLSYTISKSFPGSILSARIVLILHE